MSDGSNKDPQRALVFATGDIIVDEPDPYSFFEPSRELLSSGDFVIGQIEVPHTDRGEANSTDIPAPPAAPENLNPLKDCGFNLCTTCGNHAHDNGVPGIVDTLDKLRSLGIAVTGTGRNIQEAKTPAIAERKGIRVGLIGYNAVGPREGWATSHKAGVSYVQILTHHEPSPRATPGLPARVYTFTEPDSVEEMQEEIRAARKECDVLFVALHKGMVHTHAELQMYEKPLAHAAIDAGADAVIGHHAHILRGIEVYRGKPIYHNLGNFVCVTHALTPTGDNNSRSGCAGSHSARNCLVLRRIRTCHFMHSIRKAERPCWPVWKSQKREFRSLDLFRAISTKKEHRKFLRPMRKPKRL